MFCAAFHSHVWWFSEGWVFPVRSDPIRPSRARMACRGVSLLHVASEAGQVQGHLAACCMQTLMDHASSSAVCQFYQLLSRAAGIDRMAQSGWELVTSNTPVMAMLCRMDTLSSDLRRYGKL